MQDLCFDIEFFFFQFLDKYSSVYNFYFLTFKSLVSQQAYCVYFFETGNDIFVSNWYKFQKIIEI